MRNLFLLSLMAGGLLSATTTSATVDENCYRPGSCKTQGITAKANVSDANTRANQDVMVPHRKVYGFFLSNFSWGGFDYGMGEFFMDQPANATLLYPFDGMDAFYSGAVANGIYYGCQYEYTFSGPPTPMNVIAIDLITGERKELGPWTASNSLRLQDMTYDVANKIMYVCGFNMGSSILFTLDLENGSLTELGTLPKTIGTLAADRNGVLYGISQTGVLYRIDPQTTETTEVLDLGLGSLSGAQTMEFDLTDNTLYWAANLSSDYRNYVLYKMNVEDENISPEMIGPIGGNNSETVFKGMYIPFVLAGENAPAAPTEISVTAADDAQLKAFIKAKAPTKSFGGEDLSSINSLRIYRNNELIADIPATEVGEFIEYTDEVPANAEFRYAICATNDTGEGEKYYISRYVGEDAPERVLNVSIFPSDGCSEVTLTWDKPQIGLHGGSFKEENISYRIKRYPDEVTIADQLKDCGFTDENIPALQAYYYEIVAYNDAGSSSYYTNYLIAGPSMAVPFTDYFDSFNAVRNIWTAVDNNNDSYTWQISSGLGAYEFEDGSSALEYFIDPYYTDYTIDQDADEWLISPPFTMTEDKQYTFSFKARSFSKETFEIHFGSKNTIGAMTLQAEFEVDANDAKEFTDYSVNLPVVSTPHCVAIRLTSPFPANRKSFFQLTEANMKVNTTDNLTADLSEKLYVYDRDGQIAISGNYLSADIYASNGTKIGSMNQTKRISESMPKGIYIVNVRTETNIRAFKVAID